MPPVESHEDPKIRHITDFMDRIAYMTATGNHLAEFLPWLRHLPSWIAPWKRYAENCYSIDSRAFETYSEVKNRMVCIRSFPFLPLSNCCNFIQDSGDESPSITANLIKSSNVTKHEVAWLSAALLYGTTLCPVDH
jgi:hypothetical protein